VEEVAVNGSTFLVPGRGHYCIVLPLWFLYLIHFTVNVSLARFQILLLTVKCAIVWCWLASHMATLDSSSSCNHAVSLLATLLLVCGGLRHAGIVLLLVKW
jgi:hypothetical protein